MNIEIANRLVQMRKKMGLSQEQLADKLGLSRQAVSKWERAEASPDTDNLICLAKLYGVSLDELLSTEDSEETIVEEQVKPRQEEKTAEDEETVEAEVIDEKKGKHVHIGKDGIFVVRDGGDSVTIDGEGIHIQDKDGETRHFPRKKSEKEKRFEIITGALVGLTALLAAVAYVLLGCFIPSTWAWGWVLFLLIPFNACLFETIKKRRWGPFSGCVAMMATAAFFLLGFLLGYWHPGWVAFLAIPIYGTIAGAMDKVFHPEDEEDEEDGD